jgi:anti-sigma factor RsiW
MVTGMHPDDVDLFDYVEEDLSQRRRAELEVHLASCARCAEQVASVRAGREALREAQFLKLSQRGRDAIFVDLPSQPRSHRRRWPSLKQVAAVAAPVAALVAVVVALSTLDGNGGDQSEAGGAAEPASPTAAAEAGGGGGGDEETAQDRATKVELLFAAGPADDVASTLRSQGFDAEVIRNHVEVRDTTRAEVKRALEGRRDGGVRIVIVP